MEKVGRAILRRIKRMLEKGRAPEVRVSALGYPRAGASFCPTCCCRLRPAMNCLPGEIQALLPVG